jgi:catechol 2,3-dioxygenase-like lactoylglutathione lyase family enzyme
MAGQGFHHVAIRAIDFDATLKFYAEGLGCSVRVEFSVPDGIDRAAFLDMGDAATSNCLAGAPLCSQRDGGGARLRNRPKALCCTSASASPMLRPPIPVR